MERHLLVRKVLLKVVLVELFMGWMILIKKLKEKVLEFYQKKK